MGMKDDTNPLQNLVLIRLAFLNFLNGSKLQLLNQLPKAISNFLKHVAI